MHAMSSLFLDIEEYNPEIEHFLSRMKAKKYETEKKKVEEQNPSPKQFKKHFTPTICDSSTRSHMPTVTGHLRSNLP